MSESQPLTEEEQVRLTYRLNACKAVLADREAELLAIKGPCSNKACRLHYAHSGPCAARIEAGQ